jgi:hypothetical protein
MHVSRVHVRFSAWDLLESHAGDQLSENHTFTIADLSVRSAGFQPI